MQVVLIITILISSIHARLHGSCPLVYPPLNLGTGSLNQLVDTAILHFFVPESTIEIAQKFELKKDVIASDIRIYQLDTIRRTCPIELMTNDSLGCTERGLLLKVCLGASQIRVNLSLTTPYPGLKNGRYTMILPSVTISLEARLFAPALDDALRRKQLVQIVKICSSASNDLTVKPIESGWAKSAVSGLAKTVFPFIRSRLIQGLDDYLLQMLNDRLKAYQIHPLFVPKPAEPSSIESERNRVKRSAEHLQVIRETPRLMAFPLH